MITKFRGSSRYFVPLKRPYVMIHCEIHRLNRNFEFFLKHIQTIVSDVHRFVVTNGNKLPVLLMAARILYFLSLRFCSRLQQLFDSVKIIDHISEEIYLLSNKDGLTDTMHHSAV